MQSVTWTFLSIAHRVWALDPSGSALLCLNEIGPSFPSTSVPDSQPHTAAAVTTQSPSALICTPLTFGQSVRITRPVITVIKGDKILLPQLELPEGGGRPEVLHNPFWGLLSPKPSCIATSPSLPPHNLTSGRRIQLTYSNI